MKKLRPAYTKRVTASILFGLYAAETVPKMTMAQPIAPKKVGAFGFGASDWPFMMCFVGRGTGYKIYAGGWL